MLGAVKISFVEAEVALNSPHSCAALKRTPLILTAQPNIAKSEFQPVHHVDQRRLSAYKKNDPTPEKKQYRVQLVVQRIVLMNQ